MNENFQSADVHRIFVAAHKLPLVAENDVVVFSVYIEIQRKIVEFVFQKSGKRA